MQYAGREVPRSAPWRSWSWRCRKAIGINPSEPEGLKSPELMAWVPPQADGRRPISTSVAHSDGGRQFLPLRLWVLFGHSTDCMTPTPASPNPLIQMLTSSRNTLTDTLSNSALPALWVSLSPGKSTHEINHHKILMPVRILKTNYFVSMMYHWCQVFLCIYLEKWSIYFCIFCH